jgi:hypothetical protein
MPAKKAKKATKKLKKAKKLQPTKPLTEAITFPYGGLQVKYVPQGS